jgi:hypothetical protein
MLTAVAASTQCAVVRATHSPGAPVSTCPRRRLGDRQQGLLPRSGAFKWRRLRRIRILSSGRRRAVRPKHIRRPDLACRLGASVRTRIGLHVPVAHNRLPTRTATLQLDNTPESALQCSCGGTCGWGQLWSVREGECPGSSIAGHLGEVILGALQRLVLPCTPRVGQVMPLTSGQTYASVVLASKDVSILPPLKRAGFLNRSGWIALNRRLIGRTLKLAPTITSAPGVEGVFLTCTVRLTARQQHVFPPPPPSSPGRPQFSNGDPPKRYFLWSWA